MSRPHLTIGRVAALTGLTVRALHHYDAVGLVRPSLRSGGGYRLYDDGDLRRLHQVLVFRELGFGLDAVRALIDAPAEDRREALLAQRATLERQRAHTDAVLRAVEASLATLDTHLDTHTETTMTTERLFDDCRNFTQGEYAAEAERRWGETDAWAESHRRTAGYGEEDWARIRAEADALVSGFLDAMRRGDAADSEAAMALAECHREHIERHYYACSRAMHASVAAMYTADPRFQAHYDRHADGLAAYIEAAVRANAARDGT